MAKKKFEANFDDLELFDNVDLGGAVDNVEIMSINTDELTKEATEMAERLVNRFSSLYYDKEFMNNNPTLKSNIEVELENLRLLIKMRKTDEIMHDLLARAIGQQSTNASLYKCLTTTQSSLLSIQKQMDETIAKMNKMLKEIQLELNFNAPGQNNNEPSIDDSNISRGTKAYIEKIRQRKEETERLAKQEEPNLFTHLG